MTFALYDFDDYHPIWPGPGKPVAFSLRGLRWQI